MKITLHQDPSYSETEIIIHCPQADEDVLRLVAMLRVYQKSWLEFWMGNGICWM